MLISVSNTVFYMIMLFEIMEQ